MTERGTGNGFELERVTIESPCPKRWDELRGDDRRRFCGDCALHVVNLSALTRAEGQAFLDTRSGDERVCVSVTRRADGSLVTAERSPRGRDRGRRAPAWRHLARAAASFLFGLFPLLAACRPAGVVVVGGDPAGGGVDGGPPDDPNRGCIELTGEVALPDPAASHQLDVPEAVLGRIAAPAPPLEGSD